MQHISATINRSGGGEVRGDSAENAAALAGTPLRQTRISFSNPISTANSPPVSVFDADSASESVSALSASVASQSTARSSVVGRNSVVGRMSIVPGGTFGNFQNYCISHAIHLRLTYFQILFRTKDIA